MSSPRTMADLLKMFAGCAFFLGLAAILFRVYAGQKAQLHLAAVGANPGVPGGPQ